MSRRSLPPRGKPPSLRIRLATRGDAPAVQALLRELRYRATAGDVTRRLRALSATGRDPVLPAISNGEPVGLLALHMGQMLQYREPAARITALVVAERTRGTGVGKLLVESAARLARRAGCGLLELTAGIARKESQAFYRAAGFTHSSIRFSRPLSPRMRKRLDYFA